MIYPPNIEEKIGFDKIREALRTHCISSLGQQFVDEIAFSNEYEEIDRRTGQTEEFCAILSAEESFPQQHYLDVSKQLKKAAPYGAFLDPEELFELKLSLNTIYQCLLFFSKQSPEAFPHLRELSIDLIFEPELIDKIELVIDERGKIRDDASYQLRVIRNKIVAEQNQLRKRLEQILKEAKKHDYAKEDASLTIRNGRLVVPILAEHKRRIKGLVHDESATGQTVFLEPGEIIDMNNSIRELEYEERREIIRILTKVTDEIRPEIDNLRKAYRFLGQMDFVQAKAKFALALEAVKPHFEKKRILDWQLARHPLLYLHFKSLGKKVIPLSIRLDQDQRILLISGPNAGGKSVALKTVGLLQYMFQCGLLVPVAESTRIGLFKDIFIDIGDEQSIDNDLSTYSSHLSNMKNFLQFADKYTLFLIDEFGTGTEPTMGGAIAEALLEKLYGAKAYGIITTHYANLKLFAEDRSGIINGAMQFDAANLAPSYQLKIGKPGSSFAFEIAKKIGLPDEIIQNARQKIGSQKVNFDDLLKEMEAEKKSLELKNRVVRVKEEKLEQVTAEYQKLKDYLDEEKKRILNQAKVEAKRLIQEANQRIEQTIREIKENQAEKERTKSVRKDLEEFKEKIEPEILPAEPTVEENQPEEKIEVVNGQIQEGDRVRIKGQTAIGEVLSIKGKDAEIRIGDLKSNVKLNRLEKLSKKKLKKEKKANLGVKGIDLNTRMAEFKTNLDIRGKRAEEAIPILEEFLDDALLLGQKELRIVHGKGNGVLRNLIREQLRRRKEVSQLSDEHADRGGAGVTLITLSA